MTALTGAPNRHERRHRVRAVRRALADITPNNSRPQEQSLFFSRLPAEIRFMIFQLLLSQQHDHGRPVNIHSTSPLYRLGHTFRTKIHTAILLTCRMVYYEAHLIPIKSATHHFQHLRRTSRLLDGDIWLHQITKQHGANLYHLHDHLVVLMKRNFTKFLLPHLHWKRITWTICAYPLLPPLAGWREIDRVAELHTDIELPASCQEVNLEYEIREDVPGFQKGLRQQTELCQKIGISSCSDAQSGNGALEQTQQPRGLRKRDGTVLKFDASYSKRYTWIGAGTAGYGPTPLDFDKVRVRYYTVRLCWRARVPRRDYTGYDYVDCLDLTHCGEMEGIEDGDIDAH